MTRYTTASNSGCFIRKNWSTTSPTKSLVARDDSEIYTCVADPSDDAGLGWVQAVREHCRAGARIYIPADQLDDAPRHSRCTSGRTSITSCAGPLSGTSTVTVR